MKTPEINVFIFQLMVNGDRGEHTKSAVKHVEEDHKVEHEPVPHRSMEGNHVQAML